MTKNVQAAVTYIHSHIPALDETLLDYLRTILVSNVEHFDTPDDVSEAIGEVLESVSPDKGKAEVDALCKEVYEMMSCDAVSKRPPKLLNAPVQIDALTNSFQKTCKTISPEDDLFVVARGSKQSSEKQEKLQSEIRKKQAKLEEKEKLAVAKQSATSEPVVEASTVSQQVNRRDVNIDKAGGKMADVRLENFDLSFGNKVLLRNASISLAAGRRYGLVGRNGLGKTTLLRAISKRQLMIPGHLTVWHVEQEVTGDDTSALTSVLLADERRTRLAERLHQVQLEMAAAAAGAGQSGEGDNLLQEYNRLYAEWLEIEGDRAESKAGVILHGLGFTTENQAWATRQFSGGWRMRLALARALFCRPDLLLLDEPTNMLDLKAILWLEHYLVNCWPGTVLVVSHDRVFLDEVCTDIVHLHDLQLDVYPGDYATFVKTRKERLAHQQSAYEAQMLERQHIQVFIDTFRYNANRAALVQSKIKLLERMPKLEPVKPEPKVVLRFPEVEKLSPPILMLSEVQFHYDAKKPIFQRMDFNATMESKIGLVGENGAGKTTLLKLLLGELQPVSGERHANGGLRLGYYHQHHVDQLDLSLTPLQIMQARYPNQPAQAYYDQLGAFGVSGELANKTTITLSGGQKARVQFAVMCFPKPNFLILDEPTNHLDMETITALGKALVQFRGGLVLVSHDERLLEVVCTEIWLVGGGNKAVERLENGMKEYRAKIIKELQAEQALTK